MTTIDCGNTKVVAVPYEDSRLFVDFIEAVFIKGEEPEKQQKLDYGMFLCSLYEQLSGKSADCLVKLPKTTAETVETNDTVGSQDNRDSQDNGGDD